ncbi:MAG: hypothetical protein FJ280_11770 [Planctomycetes bacterium]|nr:hypothetical protein [Planctomycetota bacterium]
MLADLPIVIEAGRLEPEIQLPGTARYALLDFIAEELPRWRDHPEREPQTSEVRLTDQLWSYLNSAARISVGWSRIQFRTEVPDEVEGRRAVDLAVRPCGAILVIEGRRHTEFHSLLPIECKRLPTPQGRDRDEREYVVTKHGSTGGVHRFKFGHHGGAHRLGAMIAYVQEMTFSHWLGHVNGWIQDLSAQADSGWSSSDRLSLLKEDSIARLCTLYSHHLRKGDLKECELRHLWIRMN